jgi:predicted ATPase/DNA-binding SARP family transcriptional activator
MEFAILGPLEVRRDGHVVAVGGGKPRAVLAALLLRANEPVSAERLAAALWGDDAPAAAVRTVHVHVSRLRRALGDPEVLATTTAGYRLRVETGQLDLQRFEQLVDEGRHALADGRPKEAGDVLREALGLWRGPPPADLAFEPFAQAEIARLEEQRFAAVEVRMDADLAAGHHAELVPELQRLLAEHPLREGLHGRLMLAFYRAGRQADALEAYTQAREALVDQLGVEPGPELRKLQQAILAHDPALVPRPAGVAALLDQPGALPAPATVLFGRERDVGRLGDLVRAFRLVSVVGAGGVGKTRLAIDAAARLAGEFRDGTRFVALAPVADAGDLTSVIARGLGAPVSQGEPATSALLRFLGVRRLLLVLDNFEHLMEAAPLLAQLLAACPELAILVTSREPTRLAGEHVYPLSPLEVPGADQAPAMKLARVSAVAMFCDRGRAHDPDFALDGTTAPHVVEICRRLDGLPLALELAAARLDLLSPPELAARLDRALALLAGGARDAPPRQRTLRATIDWSYDLLTEPERRAFAYMSVFAGGATVAAAEEVTGASLDTLHPLVAKQLLVRREDRLEMLETVREYARERLLDDANVNAVGRRLAAWWLRFARQATPELKRTDRRLWLARLDTELPNALAALSWALEERNAELALELVAQLGAYWWWTTRWSEGLPWIDAALEVAGDGFAQLRAQALLYRARLTNHRRQEDRVREDLNASLELFRDCDDVRGVSACLADLSFTEAFRGRHERAVATSEEAIRVAQRADDEPSLVLALTQRVLASNGFDDADRAATDALPLLQRTGDLLQLCIVCSSTGYLATVERRYQAASFWLEEGITAARRLDDPASPFYLHGNRGLVKLFLNELDDAARAFCEALAVSREAAREDAIDELLAGLAAVAARQGEFSRAARLFGAATARFAPSRAPVEDAIWSRISDEIIAPARNTYGPEAWDSAARQGALLTTRNVIDFALSPEWPTTPAATTTADTAANPIPPGRGATP